MGHICKNQENRQSHHVSTPKNRWGSIGLPFDDMFVRNRPMKKQKLHPFAKLAAVSIIGAFPFLGLNDASGQQSGLVPPIVQGTNNLVKSDSNSYSYSSDVSKPLVPTLVSPKSKISPPIISGSQLTAQNSVARATEKVKTANQSLLSPIGTGIKQVAGRAEPAKIARAFSPAKMPVRAQGSGSRSAPAPAIQIQPPAAFTAPPLSQGSGSRGVAQGSGSRGAPQSAPVISGSLISPTTPRSVLDGQTGPSVSPNYFDAGPSVNTIPADSVAGCGDCGTNGCNSCGPGGCYNPNQINCDYGTYGSVSAARRYAYLEVLYLTREDGDISNSNFNPLGEFDFDPAWRDTLGQRSDMTSGREISYFGTAGIEADQITNDDQNRLDALFIPDGQALLTSDLSAFFNASQHVQFKETSVHSLEYNRVRWGWDVLKSFIGWRYIYVDDEFQLNSTAPTFDAFGVPTTESGEFRIDTVNHLLGGHIGAELFYDIGYRFSISGVSKFGVYANINEVDNFLQNDGTTLLDTEDNNATISTTYEFQLLGHYQIRQTARLRAGYNALFLGNLATTEENFSPFVSPFTGFDGSDDDDAFIHGFTFGLEIYR